MNPAWRAILSLLGQIPRNAVTEQVASRVGTMRLRTVSIERETFPKPGIGASPEHEGQCVKSATLTQRFGVFEHRAIRPAGSSEFRPETVRVENNTFTTQPPAPVRQPFWTWTNLIWLPWIPPFSIIGGVGETPPLAGERSISTACPLASLGPEPHLHDGCGRACESRLGYSAPPRGPRGWYRPQAVFQVYI